MPRVAHIVNLFQPSADSDLHLAQQVTIESMLRAKRFADYGDQIELLSAQTSSDESIVPDGFRATKNLDQDVTDYHHFGRQLKLPILKDILDRAYTETDAEYIVFSNVDIALQPHFYDFIEEKILAGHDAFIINRRRIPAKFNSVDQLDEMYKEKGLSHPGFDCFVFHRDLYPKFSLAEVCTGVPFIGITLAQNLFCFAENPIVYTDKHLTFHIGLEVFKKRAPREYFNYNRRQFWLAMEKIWPQLNTRKWPDGHAFILYRLIKWGLNPSLPIRLAFKLEPRRWFN